MGGNRVRALLYVHGSFCQETWINVSLPYLVWPVRNTQWGAGSEYLTRFWQRAGPPGEIWDCEDECVALRGGELVYVGRGA